VVGELVGGVLEPVARGQQAVDDRVRAAAAS
jgi:hypothetical protein